MTYKCLLYDVKDQIATLTLNRPERLNALGDTLRDDLHDAIVKLVVAGFRDRLAFNPAVSAEAGIAAWHCISEGVAVDIFNIRQKWTDEPVTREVIRLITQDEVRHVELGWAFLEQRCPHMTKDQLKEIENAVRDVIENV